MTFGQIPKPVTLDERWTDTATINAHDVTVDSRGAAVRAVLSTTTLVPCHLEPMSAEEIVKYGKAEDSTLYTLFLPFGYTITGENDVVVGGVTYECASSSERFPDEGYQTIAVRRYTR